MQNKNKFFIFFLIIIFFVYQFFNFIPMSRKKYIARLRKSEGKFGSSDTDPASKNRPPDSLIHTVAGVTWTTFQNNSKSLGYEATTENFLGLINNDILWHQIFEKRFVKIWGSQIEELEKKCPALAYQIIDLGFNSGSYAAERLLAKLQREKFGIKDSNITKQEIIQNFLKSSKSCNEKIMLVTIMREKYYKTLPTYWKYGKGWINRLNNINKDFAPTLIYKATV